MLNNGVRERERESVCVKERGKHGGTAVSRNVTPRATLADCLLRKAILVDLYTGNGERRHGQLSI